MWYNLRRNLEINTISSVYFSLLKLRSNNGNN